jgi:two-component system, OmpR family, sensor histidine kinase CpxA
MTEIINKLKPTKIKLFWKILLWYWISSISIIMLNIFIIQLSSEKINFTPLSHSMMKELKILAKNTQHHLNNVHNLNLPLNKKRIAKRYHLVFILDKEGNDFFGREAPEVLYDLHAKVLRNKKELSAHRKRRAFLGGLAIKINGEVYYLYSLRNNAVLSKHFIGNIFRDLTYSFLISIFVIGFPVSFLLSWLFTRPIKRLQMATRKIGKSPDCHQSLEQLCQRNDEFGELACDFKQMAVDLNATLNAQKQLLSDVSHELRSPLSRLQLALGLIDKKQLNDPKLNAQAISQEIERIDIESKRMNDMLENLLLMSKLESQERMNVCKEKLNLTDLVKSLIEDAQYEAQQSNCRINLIAHSAFYLTANQESLLSGIENILRNAIKYSGKNSLIECQLEQVDDQIKLTISDNGPGVDEQELNKIFDDFYRPEFARSRESGGTGLGLSIAKRALKINGGCISASNLKPTGLQVKVVFDLI